MADFNSVKKLLLVNNAFGVSYDILNSILEFSLFEDIHTNCLEATLIINDTNNIQELVNISGNEGIYINYTSNQYTQDIELFFDIFSLDAITPSSNTGKTLVLKLCSRQFLTNTNTKLNKIFRGSSSAIIEDILTNNLNVLPNQQSINQTDDFKEFLVPNWTPLKTINYLADNVADVEYDDASYLFFQTTKRFVFTSIQRIKGFAKSVQPKMRLSYNPHTNKIVDKLDIIKRIDVGPIYNLKKNVRGGLYGNTSISHDIIRKTINNTTILYKETDTNILNASKLTVKEEYNPDNKISIQSENYNDQDINFVTNNRPIQILEMEQYRLVLEVSGNTELEVGDTIIVDIPSAIPNIAETLDNQLAGTYMISKIKTILTKVSFVMVLEIYKDSNNAKK